MYWGVSKKCQRLYSCFCVTASSHGSLPWLCLTSSSTTIFDQFFIIKKLDIFHKEPKKHIWTVAGMGRHQNNWIYQEQFTCHFWGELGKKSKARIVSWEDFLFEISEAFQVLACQICKFRWAYLLCIKTTNILPPFCHPSKMPGMLWYFVITYISCTNNLFLKKT